MTPAFLISSLPASFVLGPTCMSLLLTFFPLPFVLICERTHYSAALLGPVTHTHFLAFFGLPWAQIIRGLVLAFKGH